MNDGSRSVLVSDIWHVSGGQTVTQTLDAGGSFSSQPYLSSDTDGQAPEGVLGVTAPLLRLLESHYVMAYAGTGSADNRTAQVVEAWRADGSLAARFWLDDATKLPLERQVFDSAAHLIGRDVFIDVSFANQGPSSQSSASQSSLNQGSATQSSAPDSARSSADPQGPWTDPLSHAQLLALPARGWLVPSELPGGLSLFTGAETEASTGTVLDLGYSDGLSVISVFEQRGNLAPRLAGWRRTTVDGHVIFVAEPDQRSLTWSSRGMVYTVMAGGGQRSGQVHRHRRLAHAACRWPPRTRGSARSAGRTRSAAPAARRAAASAAPAAARRSSRRAGRGPMIRRAACSPPR